MKITIAKTLALLFTLSFATSTNAQESNTGVTVGRNGTGATASFDGLFGIAKTKVKSGDIDVGRGLAIGVGQNGLTLSHTIGGGKHGVGLGHTMQLNIGENGTHFGHGAIVSQGGQNQFVQLGSQTTTRNGVPQGGNVLNGFGQNNQAFSQSQTVRRPVYNHFNQQRFPANQGQFRANHQQRPYGQQFQRPMQQYRPQNVYAQGTQRHSYYRN